MAIGNPVTAKDVVFIQRSNDNTAYGEVHISGALLIPYFDEHGNITADTSASFFDKFPVSGSGAGGGTTLFTASTYDITASWAVSASWAPAVSGDASISSSWASHSFDADSSSFASRSLVATSASWASNSFSAVSSSWASSSISSIASISASWASRSFSATTASFASESFYATSASFASRSLTSTSSSWASASISSSYAITASWADQANAAISASWASRSFAATSASWASSSISSSYALTSSFSSFAISASWSPGSGPGSAVSKVVVLCAAFTPATIGADAAEIPIPYSTDGITPVSWSVKRINIRVQLSGSTSSSFTLEKSIIPGVFTATSLGTLKLLANTYEATTGSSGSVNSGDKVRFNVVEQGTAQYWTITTEITSL